MIFEKYKPLILGLWALFSFSVYSGNIYAKQTENTTVPQPVQNATVKGVVKDATGEPLIGVSVVVKGTTNGAVTDVNGNFSIACSANDILVFSYIGYDKIEVKAGNASFHTITMKEDSELLDEVIVIGYGTTTRKHVIGAVDQIRDDVIKDRPVANITQALQGATPSLSIQQPAIKTYNASGNTYEALTAPQTVVAGKPFIRVELGSGTFYFRPQNNVVLAAGSRYKYTVKVNATGLTLDGCTIGDWADGGSESGEAEDLGYSIQNDGSYTVYNADGLLAWNKAVQKDESINCTLTADIDLTGREWTRIGTWPGYSGVFNGQGHRITGLNFSAATTELFGLLNERGVIKNLQLIDVNLYGNSGSAAGIVEQNNGQIIACSVTGKISAYGRTCGIADLNYGRITACWFDGTLKEYESGAIVRYNYKIITSCYWGGNVGQGVFRDHGEKVDATKVDGATVKWQTAVDGMNTALTAGDYQWVLGTDGLPVLQKKQ